MRVVRLLVVSMIVAIAAVAVVGGSAAAEPPEVYEGSVPFVFANPCTGDIELITVNFENRVVRKGAFVQTLQLELATSTGGIGSGHQTIITNQPGSRGTITSVTDYPDGSRVKVLLRTDGDPAQGANIVFANAVCAQP